MLRDVGAIVAGRTPPRRRSCRWRTCSTDDVELAFDHQQIARDAIERVRVELEVTGVATAFVGSTFTLAELRAVYEAIWGVQLDAANFRRSVVSEDGWVIPTGVARSPARPAAGPPSCIGPGGRGITAARSIVSPDLGGQGMKAVVHDRFGPPEVLRIEDVGGRSRRTRGPRRRPCDDGQPDRLPRAPREADRLAFHDRFLPPEVEDAGKEFAGEVEAVGPAVTEFAVGDRVFGMKNYGTNAELVTARESRLVAHLPEALSFEEGAAVIDGAYQGLVALRRGRVGKGTRCSCTAPRARAERRACSSGGISVRT